MPGKPACCSNDSTQSDDIVNILIFGVTGVIGRAVALAGVSSPWMRVYGFTRMSPEEERFKNNYINGVIFVTGDMADYDTVLSATKDIDVIFFSTFFWESMNPKTEYMQGRNVVTAAMQNGVNHIIYLSTDYNHISGMGDETSDEDTACPCFEAKAKIADFIVYTGIPYTIVRAGWFYENFLSVFRPHPTSKTKFAIALPMENAALNMCSLKDAAKCIITIALRPAFNIHRTVGLAATYLTVKQIAQIFEDHFDQYTFFDPYITLDEYAQFDFQGAKELTAMFHHYQQSVQWDTKIMYEYAYSVQSFDDWLTRQKQEMTIILDEQIVENIPSASIHKYQWPWYHDQNQTDADSSDVIRLPSIVTSRFRPIQKVLVNIAEKTKLLAPKSGTPPSKRKTSHKWIKNTMVKPIKEATYNIGVFLGTIKESQV